MVWFLINHRMKVGKLFQLAMPLAVVGCHRDAGQLDLNGMTWFLHEFAGDGSLGACGRHMAVSILEEGYSLVLAVGPADLQASLLQQLIRPSLESFVPGPVLADV